MEYFEEKCCFAKSYAPQGFVWHFYEKQFLIRKCIATFGCIPVVTVFKTDSFCSNSVQKRACDEGSERYLQALTWQQITSQKVKWKIKIRSDFESSFIRRVILWSEEFCEKTLFQLKLKTKKYVLTHWLFYPARILRFCVFQKTRFRNNFLRKASCGIKKNSRLQVFNQRNYYMSDFEVKMFAKNYFLKNTEN